MSPIPENFKNEAYILHGLDDARFQPWELPRKPGPNGKTFTFIWLSQYILMMILIYLFRGTTSFIDHRNLWIRHSLLEGDAIG